jgi:hypothetical protein
VRRPKHPYPALQDPEGIPVMTPVWGVWRWLGHNELPGDCWWFTMEKSRDAARRYAKSLWGWHKGMGYPKPRVERVNL